MGEIPMPEVLDPHRPRLVAEENVGNAEARAEALDSALLKAAEYGQQLWRSLQDVRQYLLDSLPPDRRHPGADSDRLGTSPTGPGDDAGWNRWIGTYAMVSSALAGPHGDSGYGLQQAEQEATHRRSAGGVLLKAERGRVEAAAEQARRDARTATVWETIGKAAVGLVGAVVVIRGLGTRPRNARATEDSHSG